MEKIEFGGKMNPIYAAAIRSAWLKHKEMIKNIPFTWNSFRKMFSLLPETQKLRKIKDKPKKKVIKPKDKPKKKDKQSEKWELELDRKESDKFEKEYEENAKKYILKYRAAREKLGDKWAKMTKERRQKYIRQFDYNGYMKKKMEKDKILQERARKLQEAHKKNK